MLEIILKNIILIYFRIKNTLKNNRKNSTKLHNKYAICSAELD
jgi:hypothetical protein